MLIKQIQNSVGLRLFIISALVLLLLIPTIFIMVMIEERQQTSKSAEIEIGEKWGKNQLISGPFLVIPYQTPFRDSKTNSVSYIKKNLIVLPESLTIAGKVKPDIRKRGIFEVVVYTSDLSLNGEFDLKESVTSIKPDETILWNEATINVGISDLSGLVKLVQINWNQAKKDMIPGAKSDLTSSGLSALINISDQQMKYSFSGEMTLNGTSSVQFIPVGKSTSVEINSEWNSPSFSGTFLPQNREITETGFSAKWNVLFLNRNFPQFWTDDAYNFKDSQFGVDLIIPVDHYQKTMRTVKYAIMFLGFTFLAFFMIEVFDKKRIHPIQYLLIGIALIIFYTLLLSITEHLSFNLAYLIACVGTIGLISLYTKSVLQNLKATLLIFGLLTILYGFMFVVLQLEDYALMIGSFGLFATLATVMYMTRKVNWYQLELKSENQ